MGKSTLMIVSKAAPFLDFEQICLFQVYPDITSYAINSLIYLSLLSRHDFGNASYPALFYDVFEKTFYERYLAARKSGDITQTAIHGVKYARLLQNQVNHRVYWLLDASARHLSKLTSDQRARLYQEQ